MVGEPHRPINKQRDIEVNAHVSSLMTEGGQWNVEKLQSLFPENEVKRILQMPIGNIPDQDIWAYSPHGSYTVKSGFEVASKLKEMIARQAESTQPGLLELEISIWKVPTLPKINFLWRAASGALAVAERLNSRGLNLDPVCKLCKVGTESIEHVLFKCDIAQEVWATAGFQPVPNLVSMSLVKLLTDHLQ